jgi:hypothetical protein
VALLQIVAGKIIGRFCSAAIHRDLARVILSLIARRLNLIPLARERFVVLYTLRPRRHGACRDVVTGAPEICDLA